jgi:hypothetical protein
LIKKLLPQYTIARKFNPAQKEQATMLQHKKEEFAKLLS